MARRTIHVVTNRDPKGRGKHPSSFGTGFSKNDAEDLRFARLSVEVSASELKRHAARPEEDDPGGRLKKMFERKVGRAKIHLYEESILDDHTEFEDGAEAVYGSVALFEELRKAMADDRDVLIYVHGYNVPFKSAAADALALQERLASPDVRADSTRKDPAVVLFTWPSDGRKTPWVSYRSDRLEAAPSGYALGRALLKVRDFLLRIPREQQCGRNLNLLCHSMGNFVLQNAIERVAIHSPGQRLPRLLDQVFLVAADVDDDVLRDGRPMAKLPDVCDAVHVYFNERDLALRISDATKANPERLGARGPSHPNELHQKVHQIDCTPWAHEFDGTAGHGYQLARRLLRDARVWLDGETELPGWRRPGPKASTWRI